MVNRWYGKYPCTTRFFQGILSGDLSSYRIRIPPSFWSKSAHGHWQIWGFPQSWGIPKIDGLFHGRSQSKMDDDWGYPYDETDTSILTASYPIYGHITWYWPQIETDIDRWSLRLSLTPYISIFRTWQMNAPRLHCQFTDPRRSGCQFGRCY